MSLSGFYTLQCYIVISSYVTMLNIFSFSTYIKRCMKDGISVATFQVCRADILTAHWRSIIHSTYFQLFLKCFCHLLLRNQYWTELKFVSFIEKPNFTKNLFFSLLGMVKVASKMDKHVFTVIDYRGCYWKCITIWNATLVHLKQKVLLKWRLQKGDNNYIFFYCYVFFKLIFVKHHCPIVIYYEGHHWTGIAFYNATAVNLQQKCFFLRTGMYFWTW